jgi:hypothetical protein
LARDALLTTLHPLLDNVLQTVDHVQISCLGAPFSRLEKHRNFMGRDLDSMADVLMEFHRSTFSKPNKEFNSDLAPWNLWAFPNMKQESMRQEISKWSTVCSTFSRSGWSVVRSASLAKKGTSKRERHRTSAKIQLRVIRLVQELCKRPSYLSTLPVVSTLKQKSFRLCWDDNLYKYG